jgi:HD-GYP domain-containing protein (c-di-GMP phosphodiesterase class II)
VKRRSIRKIVLFFLVVIIAGTLLAFSFFLFYTKENRLYLGLSENVRTANQTLNRLISKINQLNLEKTSWQSSIGLYTETPEFNSIYQEYLRDYENVRPLIGQIDATILQERIPAYPFILFEGTEASVIISEIGDIIRGLNRIKEETERKNGKIPDIIFGINVVTLFSSLISIVLLIRIFFNFTRRIEKAFTFFGALMNRESEGEVFNPIWEEEKHIHQTISQLEQQIRFEQYLLETQNIGTLEDLLPSFLPIIRSSMVADRIAFAFLDGFDNVVAETAVSVSGKMKLSAGYTMNISQTTLSSIQYGKPPRIIEDLEHYYQSVHQSEATRLLLEEGIRSSITAPVGINNRVLGFFFVSSYSKNAFQPSHAVFLGKALSLLKYTLLNSHVLQQVIAVTAETFADLVEKKDSETGNHILRVSRLARVLGEYMAEESPEITPKFLRELYWFTPLHDIGKIGIPDHILLKSDKLTPEEFAIMKTHVTIGETVLRQMQQTLQRVTQLEFLNVALDGIAGHHEKWDGTGYPKGLKGERIPIAGRILAVADVFDALMSERPYKKAYGFEKSYGIIIEGKGKHFDPRVIDAFIAKRNLIREIYTELPDS